MSEHNKNVKRLGLAALISSTALTAPAYAQATDQIIVTSTKRAQSVTDVPYNISAIDGDVLAREGITDIATLARRIPGVVFLDKGPRSAGAFANSISMRGLNVDGAGNTSDRPGNTAPTVATYVGSTPVFTSIRLQDLERVEVLRGPQGTLYGSGAMGGIVQLVPKKPEIGATEATISTRFGFTQGSGGFNNETDLVFNLPVNDMIALRANLGRVDNDGFIDHPAQFEVDRNGVPILADPSDPANSAPVTFENNDVNNEEVLVGRAALLVAPSDSLSALFTYHYQRDEVGGRQAESPQLDNYEFAGRIDEPYERDVQLASIDVEADLGFATMTVAASHTETDGLLVKDNSGNYSGAGNIGTVLNFPDPYYGSGSDLYTAYYGNNPRFVLESARAWQENVDVVELRFASNDTDSPFSWLIGGTYISHEFQLRQEDSPLGRNAYIDGVNDGGITLIGLDGTPAASGPGFFSPQTPNDLGYFFDNDNTFEELAFFGELTFQVTDRWQVTGGIRYFDQEITALQSGGLLVGGLVETNNALIEENDVLFKANTSYDITDNMKAFFTFSEGYRRGGVNAVPASLVRAARGESLIFEPDELTSYELGVKGALLDSLNYTVTLFDIDWQNAQFNTNLTFLALIGVANLPKAENKGIEVELGGNLSDALSFNLGYSFVDTEVVESVEQADRLAVVGSQLPIPKHTASANINYFQSLSNGAEIIYTLNASYKDETPSGLFATRAANARRFQVFDDFALLDATVTWNNGPWSATAYINNLTNARGVSGGEPVAFSSFGAHDTIVRPRTFGLGFSYSFGG